MSVVGILTLIAQIAAAWLLVSIVVTLLFAFAGYRLKQARGGSSAVLMSRPSVPSQREGAAKVSQQTRTRVHRDQDAAGVGSATRRRAFIR